MKSNQSTNRRSFIKKTTLTAVGISIIPRHVLGRGFIAPSDKLNIAVIGGGGKGFSDAVNVWNNGASNIAAICDVDWIQASKAFEKFPKAKKYKDFRKVLDEVKDIDAITVSTPDHTHAPASMLAMEMNKPVYCQKPLTHHVAEARAMNKLAKEKNC